MNFFSGHNMANEVLGHMSPSHKTDNYLKRTCPSFSAPVTPHLIAERAYIPPVETKPTLLHGAITLEPVIPDSEKAVWKCQAEQDQRIASVICSSRESAVDEAVQMARYQAQQDQRFMPKKEVPVKVDIPPIAPSFVERRVYIPEPAPTYIPPVVQPDISFLHEREVHIPKPDTIINIPEPSYDFSRHTPSYRGVSSCSSSSSGLSRSRNPITSLDDLANHVQERMRAAGDWGRDVITVLSTGSQDSIVILFQRYDLTERRDISIKPEKRKPIYDTKILFT